jgi:hypothetical protein
MRIDVHAHYWTEDYLGLLVGGILLAAAGGSLNPRAGTSLTSGLSARVHE